MSISSVRCQSCSGPFVRPGRRQGPFTSLGPRAQPCPPRTLLTTRLPAWRRSHEGVTCLRPTIRMGVMGVGDLEIVIQAGVKIVGRIVIASFEKTTGQEAQPPLDVVEPCAMFGRTMEAMLMGRSTQERSPLHTAAQVLGHKGHGAPWSDQTADSEAPE